jgi:choline dehydrogenase-like flavoprotein
VILAAGAIHSPQLLQLSGIGDASLLKLFGIKTVVDLPGVGANFQDHANIRTSNSSRLNLTCLEVVNANWILSQYISQYREFNNECHLLC